MKLKESREKFHCKCILLTRSPRIEIPRMKIFPISLESFCSITEIDDILIVNRIISSFLIIFFSLFLPEKNWIVSYCDVLRKVFKDNAASRTICNSFNFHPWNRLLSCFLLNRRMFLGDLMNVVLPVQWILWRNHSFLAFESMEYNRIFFN